MTASPTAAPADPLVEALLASYAAVFAYGVVGARLPETRRGFALQALAGHRASRDWLRARITEADGKPPPASAAYDTGEVTDEAQAAALAAEVELALVPRWAAAAGVLPGGQRPYCCAQAQGAAVRAFVWGAGPQAFPGSVAAPSPTDSRSPSSSDSPTASESGSPSGSQSGSASPSQSGSGSPSGGESSSAATGTESVTGSQTPPVETVAPEQLTEVLPPAEETLVP